MQKSLRLLKTEYEIDFTVFSNITVFHSHFDSQNVTKLKLQLSSIHSCLKETS